MRIVIAAGLFCGVVWGYQGNCWSQEEWTQGDIRVAEGLRIRLVADDDLVPDCTNVTANSSDHIFATGPGYIRRLVDLNRDGIFDATTAIVDKLKHGAHGLCCDGPWLYFVADQGVWKVRLTADGKLRESEPQQVLAVKTGGEHDTHALRRGPDGNWYLMVGNGPTDFFHKQQLANPVISNPRAGAIWKISADWQTLEVWAHGFRNAFDFDFAPNGTIVTFDSDDERDVSLPWYRPTRVFEVRQGDDAGWITRSCKRPDYDPEMPKVLASPGRGSPTGVVRYRGSRLPSRFANGSFVLDWTFGRVLFVADNQQTEVVAEPIGTAGFAVTDIVELGDGRLILSVGGRGSRGGLYELDSVNPKPNDHGSPFEWQAIPRRRSEVENRVKYLRANRQANVSTEDLQFIVSQLTEIDATDERSQSIVVTLLALLCEACGGLGQAADSDPRPAVQKAAVFDSLRSQLEPKMPTPLRTSLTALLVGMIREEQIAITIRSEAIRALAVIEASEQLAIQAVLDDLRTCDHPTEKLHRLFAIGRLPAHRDDDLSRQIAEVIVDLPLQVAELGMKVDSSWASRLSECLTALQDHDHQLASRVLGHDRFGHPVHLVWAEALQVDQRATACQRLLQHPLSQDHSAVAMFVAEHQSEIDSNVLQRWLQNDVTRPAAWLHLSRFPTAEKAEQLQLAAYALDTKVRESARRALEKLQMAIKPNLQVTASAAQWISQIPQILHHEGDPAQGEKLFAVRQCAKCHNSAKALGPALGGISKRFGDSDLLRAIVDPSQTIPDRYRAIQVVTDDGSVLSGIKIYESVDGLTLMSADARTVRINAQTIVQQQYSAISLMPEGLLEGLSLQQVADLLAYLRSL